METHVTNNGVDAIRLYIKRTDDGVQMDVQTEPRVEEFFKKWGGGGKIAPDQGRYWRRVKGNTDPILVWSYAPARRNLQEDEEERYTLELAGRELITDRNVVNLSFLRLVGVSEGTSINFDMVLSRQELNNISQRILRAADQFYQDYIRTVGMRIVVSIQEER